MVKQNTSDARPSKSAGIAILVFFLVISVTCLWLPISALVDMIGSITSNSARVSIDKGVYYLFGAGIALLALLPDGLYNAVLKQEKPSNIARWVSRGIIAGLILILLLPQLVHYSTASYLENRGYLVCGKESRQWLAMRTIVYSLPGYCGNE